MGSIVVCSNKNIFLLQMAAKHEKVKQSILLDIMLWYLNHSSKANNSFREVTPPSSPNFKIIMKIKKHFRLIHNTTS